MKLTHLALSFSRMGESLPHRHTDWEIILNLEGTGVDVMDQQQHPFEPGSLVIYPPGCRHGKKADSGGFQDVFATVSNPLGFSGQSPSTFMDDNTHTIRHLMMTAHLYFQLGTEEGKSIAHSLMEAVCGILLVWNRTTREESGVTALQHAIVQHVSDASYFTRIFRRETGLAPAAYRSHQMVAMG